jgi:hypothetical protein
VQEAGDVVATGDRLGALADVAVGPDLERARLDLVRELRLPGRIGLLCEREAELLKLVGARPAEPRVLAGRDEARGADRIKHVGRDPEG